MFVLTTSPIRADETPAGPASEESPRSVPPRQKGQPSARERLRLWPRVRWCKGCGHLTDGTYVASPGPRRGALCGPGCFRHCETALPQKPPLPQKSSPCLKNLAPCLKIMRAWA